MEYAEFYNHEIRKANRAHKCCECFGIIRIGERYHHIAGKWEGEFSYYKQCSQCSELISEMNKWRDEEEYIYFGGLTEALGNSDVPEYRRRFNETAEHRESTRRFEIKT